MSPAVIIKCHVNIYSLSVHHQAVCVVLIADDVGRANIFTVNICVQFSQTNIKQTYEQIVISAVRLSMPLSANSINWNHWGKEYRTPSLGNICTLYVYLLFLNCIFQIPYYIPYYLIHSTFPICSARRIKYTMVTWKGLWTVNYSQSIGHLHLLTEDRDIKL